MTTPDKSQRQRTRDEVLAGEYVLGALTVDERTKVETRLISDRAFAAIVQRWQDNLLKVDEEPVMPRPPARAVARTIAQTTARAGAPRRPAPGLWQSLPFWRLMTVIAWSGMIAAAIADVVKP